MASIKITEVLYRKNGKKLVLTPDDMSENSYAKEYKGHLFCPHPGCSAELYFVEAVYLSG